MACDGDSGEAEYKLAMTYLRGRTIPQDYLKLYKLMKRANGKGYDRVKKLFIPTSYYSQNVPNYSEIIAMFIVATENSIDDLSYFIGFHYDVEDYASIDSKRFFGLYQGYRMVFSSFK
jgi:TPR repeat protein